MIYGMFVGKSPKITFLELLDSNYRITIVSRIWLHVCTCTVYVVRNMWLKVKSHLKCPNQTIARIKNIIVFTHEGCFVLRPAGNQYSWSLTGVWLNLKQLYFPRSLEDWITSPIYASRHRWKYSICLDNHCCVRLNLTYFKLYRLKLPFNYLRCFVL